MATLGNRAHIAPMDKVEAKITFDPRPLKVGSQWRVVATYPSERQEHITGFRSEVDAKHWITNGSKVWLKTGLRG
jgi:hypothetical protein